MFYSLKNCSSAPVGVVPELPFDTLRKEIVSRIHSGECSISALFGQSAGPDAVRIWAALSCPSKSAILVANSVVTGKTYQSITADCTPAHWFEREIAEQWGIVPEGHPALKPLRFHSSWRQGLDAWGRKESAGILPCVTDYCQITGEETHEVAVGPVHAGIIEPGHFRFQCHGEKVFQLEIELGYQHRGVELALLGGPRANTLPVMETVAGDTTIGHALAYASVIEALTGAEAPPRALALRAVALELERLANHTGDLGMLASDVAFLPTASYCGRIRGDFLNMTAVLCGNRFGRGLICPGGVKFDLDSATVSDLLSRLEAARRDTMGALDLLWATPSAVSRFESTGAVSLNDAMDLGLSGLAARACGIDRDTRRDFAFGHYARQHIPIAVWDGGDVAARAQVRRLEIINSAEFIRAALKELPDGGVTAAPGKIPPGHIAVSLAEGWRGEICHFAITNADGRFARYKIVDPSFRNWCGLALALKNGQISDFPLCNKSFNLSYCGHDL